MDPDQTAPTAGFTLFVYEASNILVDNKKHIHFVIMRYIRVNTCEVSVYMVRTFMKCTHVCADQKAY